jgi:hypothetical protein
MCGTVKRTLEQKRRKYTQVDLYKIMTLSWLLYCSETGTLRSEERRGTAAETRFLQYVADYNLAWITVVMK